MAGHAHTSGNFEKEILNLIKFLTGFQEREDNFKLCRDFALSNLKYHKFLEVDSHRVTRNLQGLKEKFFIHSEDVKAEKLQTLVDQFLSDAVYEDQECGKTDTHYGLLSLVMNLANSPTEVPYTPTKKQAPDEEAEFDWKAYLLEEEDLYTVHYADTPEWLSEDDEEEENYSVYGKTSQKDGVHFEVADEMAAADVSAMYDSQLDTSIQTSESTETWLEKQLVVQYWKGQFGNETTTSSHPSANLSIDWEYYQQQINPLHVSAKKQLITEDQLVRETLWMLHGVEKSYVYLWEADHFVVRQNIQLGHVTMAATEGLLYELAQYGTLVWELNNFIDIVVSGAQYWGPHKSSESAEVETTQGRDEPSAAEDDRNRATNTSDNTDTMTSPPFKACQTYQAFAASLSHHLQTFKKELLLLEKTAVKQEETVTLSILFEKLRPHLSDLAILGEIFRNGVLTCCNSSSNPERAACLLGKLYDNLMGADTMGQHNTREMMLLLPLFLQTCRPYLDIIHEWIEFGLLIDPTHEFIIQRNLRARKLDENFWDTAFLLHCPGENGTTKKTKSPRSDQWMNVSKSEGQQVSSEYVDGKNESETFWMPGFLLPILREVVLAGKSMELLRNLGKLHLTSNSGDTKESLYNQLLNAILRSYADSIAVDTPAETSLSSTQSSQELSIFSSSLKDQMMLKGIDDPLMRLNFLRIFHPTTVKFQSLCEQEDQVFSQLTEVYCEKLMSLKELLCNSLYQPIYARYTTVCRTLLEVFREDYNLLHYFTATRRFFLMEAGDVMHDFYTEIFEKLRLHESWQDASFLSTVLQEALHARFPEEADNAWIDFSRQNLTSVDVRFCRLKSIPVLLFVSVEKPKGKNMYPVHQLDGLTLHYRIPWPVDIVMTSRCMRVYNQVFRFLLQIKRVKYSLDELRFAELDVQDGFRESANNNLQETMMENTNPHQLHHRQQLFRMRLLHFVNSLHNYIMTRILHSIGLEFQEEIAKAVDLDQLIHIHHRYITKLHERCLLHKKVAFLKDVVTKVLNLALKFQGSWNGQDTTMNHKVLEVMETEFTHCIQFLASFLNNIIKRGSFPHLESLAFALITSSEAAKR